MDVATLGQVIKVLNLIGKNSDAAGTQTLFARLAQLILYTDGVEAKTNLIGAAGDPAGTSTMFARLAQIAGYTDTLETGITTLKSYTEQVEPKTDAVKAVVDAIRATDIPAVKAIVDGVDWKTKSFQTSLPPLSHDTKTILDISGSGYIVGVGMYSGSSSQASYAIQIDGGDIYKSNLNQSEAMFVSLFPIRFATAVKVTGSDVNVYAWVVLD